MKFATFSMFVLILAAGAFWLKACLAMWGEHSIDDERIGTMLQLTAALLTLSAVGCGIIRAINQRSDGQSSARTKANENGS